MEVYHQNATCSVADDYIKIPTIELIRRWLCGHGIGALVETSVRKLSRAIGRSAGQMSVHLNLLEAHGWIRRLADHSGTVVEVLRIDHADDRSFEASQSDHADDRRMPSDHATPARNPASHSAESLSKSDHADDPPHTPRNGTKHDSLQQQQPRESELSLCDYAGAPPVPLNAGEWGRILAGTPGYTQTHFEQDLLRCDSRSDIDNPVALIVAARSKGEPVYSASELAQRTADVAGAHPAQEQQHAQPARATAPDRRVSPNRTERSGRYPRRDAAQQPALQPGDLRRFGRRGDVPSVPG